MFYMDKKAVVYFHHAGSPYLSTRDPFTRPYLTNNNKAEPTSQGGPNKRSG